MSLIDKLIRILVIGLIGAFYFLVLWFGLTEENRRVLSIEEHQPGGDFVFADIGVTAVDIQDGLLSLRIRLIPMGKLAIDRNTPSTDLKLFINSVSGNQATILQKGVRMAPIEASIPLTGNPNHYPFDVYRGNLDLLVAAQTKAATPTPVRKGDVDNQAIQTESLIVGENDLTHSETVPIVESIHAAILGIKFKGVVTRENDHELARINFTLRRANNVIATSITVMVMMMGLAVSMMGMVWRVTASTAEINLLPLSLCVALIFGLPALRGIQPDVPGVGVFGDYVSFIWAQLLVSVSAIALAWTWILRSRKQDREAGLNRGRRDSNSESIAGRDVNGG
jgi:hypothetical protein